MLRRIYDWCIAAAHKPYALWIMGAVSFAESSFFPVPPDVMLIPMSLARPQRAWLYAIVCTLTSVAGGVVGYAIGWGLYDTLGQWLIQLYGLSDKVEAFRQSYAEWGAWIIIGKGLTPIPYKLVTITSGFAGYNIWLFVLCSLIARGGRFFIVAILALLMAIPVQMVSSIVDARLQAHANRLANRLEVTNRELQEANDELQRLAFNDPLTGVPNLARFDDRLQHALTLAARRPDRHLGVLFIDLDGFKSVNDSWGHAVGDQLLRQVAGRLRATVTS